jgi:hypothetical protein
MMAEAEELDLAARSQAQADAAIGQNLEVLGYGGGRLGPKGKGSGWLSRTTAIADVASPA